MTASRALLAGIVDYAGVFPPAALDIPAAVNQDQAQATNLVGHVDHPTLGHLRTLGSPIAIETS